MGKALRVFKVYLRRNDRHSRRRGIWTTPLFWEAHERGRVQVANVTSPSCATITNSSGQTYPRGYHAFASKKDAITYALHLRQNGHRRQLAVAECKLWGRVTLGQGLFKADSIEVSGTHLLPERIVWRKEPR